MPAGFSPGHVLSGAMPAGFSLGHVLLGAMPVGFSLGHVLRVRASAAFRHARRLPARACPACVRFSSVSPYPRRLPRNHPCHLSGTRASDPHACLGSASATVFALRPSSAMQQSFDGSAAQTISAWSPGRRDSANRPSRSIPAQPQRPSGFRQAGIAHGLSGFHSDTTHLVCFATREKEPQAGARSLRLSLQASACGPPFARQLGSWYTTARPNGKHPTPAVHNSARRDHRRSDWDSARRC